MREMRNCFRGWGIATFVSRMPQIVGVWEPPNCFEGLPACLSDYSLGSLSMRRALPE
jgi:hypothetical protein